MILSVDYGHNSVKASSNYRNKLIFPKIIANEVKDIELPDFVEMDSLDYLRVWYQKEEYMIGELAKRQSDIAYSSINSDDLLTEETK